MSAYLLPVILCCKYLILAWFERIIQFWFLIPTIFYWSLLMCLFSYLYLYHNVTLSLKICPVCVSCNLCNVPLCGVIMLWAHTARIVISNITHDRTAPLPASIQAHCELCVGGHRDSSATRVVSRPVEESLLIGSAKEERINHCHLVKTLHNGCGQSQGSRTLNCWWWL